MQIRLLCAFLTLALILFLTACSPPSLTYDLDQPIAVAVTDDLAQQPEVDAATLRADFAAAVTQLGSRVAKGGEATANPIMTLDYSDDCGGHQDANAYTDGELGHGSPTSVIYFCHNLVVREYAWRRVVAHELGHLFGAAHVECDKRNVMCALGSEKGEVYTDVDLREICRATRGGVCGR